MIKKFHELTIHKGNHKLYNLIKKNEFWWYGIYNDITEYKKFCEICQSLYKIISIGPRELYVTDLIKVTPEIVDKKKFYNFILNIIDHYSKLVGSYLLVNKTAISVLNYINNFISIYGVPNILQCDNDLEYINHFLKDYCNNKNINLIYSGIKHPTTNGVIEIVHQDIVNSLLAQKITIKK